jgi:hypothetical protein
MGKQGNFLAETSASAQSAVAGFCIKKVKKKKKRNLCLAY